jgi:hypothetical protein
MARYFGVPLRNGLPIGLGSSIGLGGAGGPSAPVGDEYFEYTTLLLPGNGTNGAQNNTFLDSSTNAFSITRNGNTTQGTFSPFSQTGWGNYFDGTGDYFSGIGTTSSFNFMHNSSALFTFECWVFVSALGAGRYLISTNDGSTANIGVGCSINSSGRIDLLVTHGSFGNWIVNATSSSSITANSWNHIAVTYDYSLASANCKFYINGVAAGTGSKNANPPSASNATTALQIGATGAGSNPFIGYISNLRITNSIVYAGAFTPPTSPLTAITNTSLLTCQSNRFVDNSSNAFAITRNGDVSVQAFSPFNPTAAWSAATYGGSGYFDGSGDYLNWTGTALGSGNFTAECWVYLTPYSTSNYAIIGSGAANTSAGWEIYLDGSVSKINLYTGGVSLISSSSTVTANQWYHIALVRSGSTATLYINGVSVGTATLTANLTNTAMYVSYDFAGQVMAGYVSGVRHVVGTAVYTGAFTPPTAPPTAITNTSFLCNFTNAGIYDATSKNDLETVGNAQISTAQSKFGGSSIYLDGTGDVLLARNNTLYGFGTGDFTIETWVYIVSGTSFGCVVGGPSGGSTWYLEYSSNRGFYFYDGTTALNGSASLVTATWKHLAVSRSGTTLRMFVDGALTATHTTSSNIPSVLLAIGAYNDNTFNINGYVDDLRITKGYARYTAAFTAPTAAFPLL